MSKGKGKVEVRVFRPLFTGPLFDLNKLKPNELNRDVYPSDEVAPRFGLRPFTIQPKEFSKPVRVYRGDPTRVTPNGLAVCHSVTFGVSGLGHLTFETREAWVLGLHFFFPPPVDPLPYLISHAAKLTALNSALVIPPETADALFKNPKIFSEVCLDDIRAGDIIAFYTTADAGELYPAGALLHSMPVRSFRPLAPAPRPAGSAVTPP